MKIRFFISIFFISSVLFFSCNDKVTREITFTANVPVYMSYEEFAKAVKSTEQQDIENPGKIYVKDNYLFINDLNKGIHVFDNSNPASPQYICFINIPGNVDMAVKGNILYADSYIDLISVDISNIKEPVVKDRIYNAFPNIYPPVDWSYPVAQVNPEEGVVVGWTIDQVTMTETEYNKSYAFRDEIIAFNDYDSQNSENSAVGTGGSMARFAVKENTLYAINNGYELKIFDICSEKITKTDSITSFWNIETLFAYENNLFIGSTTGMYIYDISSPEKPQYVSEYSHITSCDPVVVNDEYAFVTLRSGNNCANTVNELNVISLKNIEQPELVKTYPMYNPHGLGIDENLLFICDGDSGLKIYDISDVTNIDNNIINTFSDINTFDVIPYNNTLIMTGQGGIVMYDYSDINNIREISRINISSKK